MWTPGLVFPRWWRPTCGNALPGADVVYAVQTPVAGLYTARVQPERGFNVALGVTTACAAGACLDTVDALGENFREELTFSGVAGATYYVTSNTGARLMGSSSLWLQPDPAAGSFSIELVLGPP